MYTHKWSHTEGGIFDATVYQSPKTGPKQTQTGSKTAQNRSKRVSKKYPLEGRAFGKTFTWGISSDFMQKMVRKWRFFIILKFGWKMLRIGLTCIVWQADLENAVETQFRANFCIVFEISNFQTVRSKIPPSVWFCVPHETDEIAPFQAVWSWLVHAHTYASQEVRLA